MKISVLLVAVLVLLPAICVQADTYHQVSFTGNVSTTNGFGGLVWGPTITGSFVYDDNLIPAAGSGFVNVPFSSFPDIAIIPDATAFNMTLSPAISFTLSDALFFFPTQEAFIQYNNGVFVGFAYFAQFDYNGSTYEFDDQGSSWSIYAAPGGVRNLSQKKASGRNFTLGTPEVYVPAQPPQVPEPSSFAIFGSGLATLAAIRRKLF